MLDGRQLLRNSNGLSRDCAVLWNFFVECLVAFQRIRMKFSGRIRHDRGRHENAGLSFEARMLLYFMTFRLYSTVNHRLINTIDI
jgi:hypothetical protein